MNLKVSRNNDELEKGDTAPVSPLSSQSITLDPISHKIDKTFAINRHLPLETSHYADII